MPPGKAISDWKPVLFWLWNGCTWEYSQLLRNSNNNKKNVITLLWGEIWLQKVNKSANKKKYYRISVFYLFLFITLPATNFYSEIGRTGDFWLNNNLLAKIKGYKYFFYLKLSFLYWRKQTVRFFTLFFGNIVFTSNLFWIFFLFQFSYFCCPKGLNNFGQSLSESARSWPVEWSLILV